jgi:hypothetical protein
VPLAKIARVLVPVLPRRRAPTLVMLGVCPSLPAKLAAVMPPVIPRWGVVTFVAFGGLVSAGFAHGHTSSVNL